MYGSGGPPVALPSYVSDPEIRGVLGYAALYL